MSTEFRITNRNGVWIIQVQDSGPNRGTAPVVIGPLVISPPGYGSANGQSPLVGGDPDNPPTFGGRPPMPAKPVGGDPHNPPTFGGRPPMPGSPGPIIIGPIYLDGGYFGQAVPIPQPGRKASAVSLNPPANIVGPKGIAKRQPFKMEWQELQQWCWAAVAVSVRKYLNAGDAPNWTQRTLATPVLRGEGQITPAIDCAANPDLCDFGAALDDAASQTGNLAVDGLLLDHFLTFESVVNWVDKEFPVGVRIAWFGGGAHFIAIDGYRDAGAAGKMVHIQDPFYGPALHSYDDLVSNYPPGGVWQDTYVFKVA